MATVEAEFLGVAVQHQPTRSRQVVSLRDDPGVVSTDVHRSGELWMSAGHGTLTLYVMTSCSAFRILMALGWNDFCYTSVRAKGGM